MHQLTSAAVGLVPSAESLRTLFGTALDKNDDSGIALSNLALWMQSQVAFSQQVELQCTEIVRSYNPANNLMLRVGFIRLTSKMELDRNNVW
jgi:hypothetical protein